MTYKKENYFDKKKDGKSNYCLFIPAYITNKQATIIHRSDIYLAIPVSPKGLISFSTIILLTSLN